MRGDDQEQQGAMWSYVPMEQRIPAEHPLRVMRPLVDAVLRELSPQFAELYSRVGRPSIAPEKLLRALLLLIVTAHAHLRGSGHAHRSRTLMLARYLKSGFSAAC